MYFASLSSAQACRQLDFHQKNTYVLKHISRVCFGGIQFAAQAQYLGVLPEKNDFVLCAGAVVREGRSALA